MKIAMNRRTVTESLLPVVSKLRISCARRSGLVGDGPGYTTRCRLADVDSPHPLQVQRLVGNFPHGPSPSCLVVLDSTPPGIRGRTEESSCAFSKRLGGAAYLGPLQHHRAGGLAVQLGVAVAIAGSACWSRW